MKRKTTLLFYCPRENKLSVSALCGALEARPELDSLPVYFADNPRLMRAEAVRLAAGGSFVVTAFSFFTSQAAAAGELARSLRRECGEKVFLLAGGPHPSGAPEGTLGLGFDCVCVGEGEETLPDMLMALSSGEDFRILRGLAFMKGGVFVQTPARPAVNLDLYPPVSFKRERFGTVEITRGCPFGCKFCQNSRLFGRRQRHRSVEKILEVARRMSARGLLEFRCVTPDAFSYGSPDGRALNLPELERLLSGLREAMGPDGKVFYGSFPSEVRPEHVTPETVALARRYSDSDNLVIGAQSGSERMLSLCGRGHGVAEIVRAVELTLSSGLAAYVDFIFGLPGETEEDALLTLDLMRRLGRMGAKAHAHTFMPLAGTPYGTETAAPTAVFYRQAVEELCGRGMAFGHWQKQEAMSAESHAILNSRSKNDRM